MDALPRVRVHVHAAVAGLTEDSIVRTVERAWELFEGPPRAVIEVSLLDNERHTALHEQHLDDPSETDVMAFPYGDEDCFGEILVNADMSRREADARGHSPAEEARLYVAHGALHLLGFRDDEEAARQEMRVAEARVLEVR